MIVAAARSAGVRLLLLDAIGRGGEEVPCCCRFLEGDTFRRGGILGFCLACSCGLLGAGVEMKVPGSAFCGVVMMALRDIVLSVSFVAYAVDAILME